MRTPSYGLICYATQWSLWLDLAILLWTVPVMLLPVERSGGAANGTPI